MRDNPSLGCRIISGKRHPTAPNTTIFFSLFLFSWGCRNRKIHQNMFFIFKCHGIQSNSLNRKEKRHNPALGYQIMFGKKASDSTKHHHFLFPFSLFTGLPEQKSPLNTCFIPKYRGLQSNPLAAILLQVPHHVKQQVTDSAKLQSFAFPFFCIQQDLKLRRFWAKLNPCGSKTVYNEVRKIVYKQSF